MAAYDEVKSLITELTPTQLASISKSIDYLLRSNEGADYSGDEAVFYGLILDAIRKHTGKRQRFPPYGIFLRKHRVVEITDALECILEFLKNEVKDPKSLPEKISLISQCLSIILEHMSTYSALMSPEGVLKRCNNFYAFFDNAFPDYTKNGIAKMAFHIEDRK